MIIYPGGYMSRSAGPGELGQLEEQLFQLLRRVAVGGCPVWIKRTLRQRRREVLEPRLLHGPDGSGKLGHDVGALTTAVDHPLDTTDLTFDSPQSAL